MRMKWLALLLAGVMCVSVWPGLAEGSGAFDVQRVAPLLNAVTSAALGVDEAVTLLEEEEAVTAAFAQRLSKALQAAGLDAGAMGDLVAMALPAQGADEGADVAQLTLQVLTTNVSGDGDAVMIVGEAVGTDGQTLNQRAVIELRQEDASPIGWKLYRFTVGDVELEEELLNGYFAETMLEYMNADCGYIIQYPAIFTEEMIVQTDTGIQAALPDETASFAVSRAVNEEGLDLDGLRQLEQANTSENVAAKVWINEDLGCVQSVVTDEEGITHAAVFLVSESYIYQAELNYPQDQAAEYEQYADYMINSFSADELGHG